MNTASLPPSLSVDIDVELSTTLEQSVGRMGHCLGRDSQRCASHVTSSPLSSLILAHPHLITPSPCHTLTSSRLHTLTSSRLHTLTSSHLHTVMPHHITPSHPHLVTPSHPHHVTPSPCHASPYHAFTPLTSSHLRLITPSHPYPSPRHWSPTSCLRTLTLSRLHILTLSHLHILTSSRLHPIVFHHITPSHPSPRHTLTSSP